MRCGLMSFSSARSGISPSATASPPQNGSTRRRCAWLRQRRCSRGTCQRLPPAHFNGGFSADVCTPRVYGESPLLAAVRELPYRLDADVGEPHVARDLFRLLLFLALELFDAELTAGPHDSLDHDRSFVAVRADALDFDAAPHELAKVCVRDENVLEIALLVGQHVARIVKPLNASADLQRAAILHFKLGHLRDRRRDALS